MLGRKQSISHEAFVQAWDNIANIVSQQDYNRLKARTVRDIKRVVGIKPVAFGWSGGKDSIALEAVCKAAKIDLCVFGMTNHLEYTEFLRWVTDHMPEGLTILKNGWDLEWLSHNQHMLFPPDCEVASKWFKGVQHRAQELYYRDMNLEILILGRRKIDGNYVGEGNIYEAKGIVRYSPLADWSHEDILASLYYEGWTMDGLPPFYRWPRGFRCGTHAWPARQWCQSVQDGWSEVYSIEPDIVEQAAELIDSARVFLDSLKIGVV